MHKIPQNKTKDHMHNSKKSIIISIPKHIINTRKMNAVIPSIIIPLLIVLFLNVT